MRSAHTCIVLIVAVAAGAAAQAPRKVRPQEKQQVVRLKASPAPEPRAALTYLLLPPVLDQSPGNAAQLYYLANEVAPREKAGKWSEKIEQWMETPPEKLPLKEVAKALGEYSTALRQLELAARREYCHWDLPVRSERMGLVLPELGRYRRLARVLAVKVRLSTAKGDFEQAIHDLQTGFAMSRHVGEGPTLIQPLVGTAISAIMVDRVEELMQAPGAPNLYWALTWLPRPLVDLRGPMQWEAAMVYLMLPPLRRLRDLKTAELTPAQWRAGTDDLVQSLHVLTHRYGKPESSAQTKLALTALAVHAYPRAKQYLRSLGRTDEQIAAMPVQQVVAVYHLETFDRLRDESFKWFHVPYWQARAGLQRAADALDRAKARGEGLPFTAFLPALGRAYFLTAKLDRHVAALRCIEAVRMYAAGHDGKPPARLSDITAVPVPIDPVTGKPFAYKAVGDTVTLEGRAPAPDRPKDDLRYELTLTK